MANTNRRRHIAATSDIPGTGAFSLRAPRHTCTACSYSTIYLSRLERHIRTMHPIAESNQADNATPVNADDELDESNNVFNEWMAGDDTDEEADEEEGEIDSVVDGLFGNQAMPGKNQGYRRAW